MSELQLKLDKVDGSILTVLQGNAPKQPEISPVKITGNIYAVEDYLKQRSHDKKVSHILVDANIGAIVLLVNPESTQSITVTGKVEVNPLLAKIGINKDTKYNTKELVKMLKFNKHLFDSPQDVDAAIERLTKLNISVSSKIEKSLPDAKGSVTNNYQKTIEAESINVVFNCELYSGSPKVKFTVEIWMDVEGQAVQFWLESVTYAQLEVEMKEQLVKEVVEGIKEISGFDLPIITA
jgi:hypothetical protein